MTTPTLIVHETDGHKYRILGPDDTIHSGHYVEWHPGAWASIVRYSPFVGLTVTEARALGEHTGSAVFGERLPIK